MKMSRKFRDLLEKVIAYKKQLEKKDNLEPALDYLYSLYQKNGIVRIVSDRSSASAADHLHEELVVRYKAGSAFNREDRRAVNSRLYSEYNCKHIINLIEKGSFDSSKDLLVCFASSECEGLRDVIKAAKACGLPSFIVAPESVSNEADWKFTFPSESLELTYYFHVVALHTLCEKLEPEYSPLKYSFSAVIESTLEQDLKTLSDSTLIESVTAAEKIINASTNAAIFLAGNGGSACDVNSLVHNIQSSSAREVFNLHSTGALLASYNDGYPVFARQLEASGKAGDIFMAYSTSGNSQNLIDAVQVAKAKGIATIGMLGRDGGKLARICDHSIVVPFEETARIQELHGLIGAALLL